jgi:hypothetical protein
LRDETRHTDVARRRQQMVGAFGAQAVADGERLVEGTQVGGVPQVGHLVHDHIRLCGGNGCLDRFRVKTVRDHRLGAERAHRGHFRRPVCETCDRMSAGHENGNEMPSNCACGACYEDAHGSIPKFLRAIGDDGAHSCG